jgi:hypothetical protein
MFMVGFGSRDLSRDLIAIFCWGLHFIELMLLNIRTLLDLLSSFFSSSGG